MRSHVCRSVLVAVLVTACLSMPMMSDSQKSDRATAQRDSQRRAVSSERSRRDLLNSLSLEQRQFLLKAFPEAFTELSNKDAFWHELAPLNPMHDRDYEGWMDFGRRDVEDLPQSS